MNADVYKISINLRKSGGAMVTVAGRGPLGYVLRSSGAIVERKNIGEAVEKALDEFDKFDEVEMARAQALSKYSASAQYSE